MPTPTYEPITTFTTTGSQTAVSLVGLTGYKHLMIECVFSSPGNAGMYVIPNSNTTNNGIRNDFMWTYSGGGAPNELIQDNTGYTYINPGGNLAANLQGITRIHIFNASSTSTFKAYYIETSWESNFNHGYGWGTLHTTNAIDQFTIASGTNWSSGSKFTCFGLVG